MRRAMALGAVGALIGLGAAAAVPAMGATTNLRFFTVETAAQETDNGFLVVEKVLQEGKKVGTDRVLCTFRQGKAHCKITVRLTGRGQLKLTTTLSEQSQGGKLRITGGTGEFAGASGDGSFKNITDSKSRVDLRVTT